MSYDTEEARAKHREEQRRYRKAHPDAARESTKRWMKRHPGYKTLVMRRYAAANPEKRKAQRSANKAVRQGRLIRPNQCSSCGKSCVPEGHHPDYSKRLEVIWVCIECHREIHRAMRRAALEPK